MDNISLFKAGRNGYWTIQYTAENGIRKQKSTGCKNKAEAIKGYYKTVAEKMLSFFAGILG